MNLAPALRLALQPHAPDVVAVVGGGGKTSLVFRLAHEIVARGLRVVTATTTRVALHQTELAPAHLRLRGSVLPVDALARALDAHSHCLLLGDETLLNGKQTGIAPEVVDALAAQAAALGVAAIVIEADGSRTLPVKAPAAHEPVVPASTTLLVPVIGMEAVGARLDDTHAHRPERIRDLLGITDPAARLTPAQAARLLLHSEGGAKARPAGARMLPVCNKAEAPPARAAARLVAGQIAGAGTPALIAAAGIPDAAPVLERLGPLAVIVLAAGASRRFGAAKQVAVVDGEPMALRAARTALAAGAQQVIVVTGAHAAAVEEALAPLRAIPHLWLVHNPDWAQGQSTSLRAGLAALDPATEAVICLPVDQPFVPSALLRRMAACWRAGADLVAPATPSGAEHAGEHTVRGAPALFDRSHFAALAAVSGDQGGRALLRDHPVTTIAVDAALLADIDAPEDLRG